MNGFITGRTCFSSADVTCDSANTSAAVMGCMEGSDLMPAMQLLCSGFMLRAV
jgi:hypothetical protein